MIATISVAGRVMVPHAESIPVHWSASGEVNRTGSHIEAFVLIPAIALVLTLVLSVAPHLDPRGRNLQLSKSLWLAAWLGSLVILAIAQGVITLSAIGVIDAGGATVRKVTGSAVAAFIAIIGNGRRGCSWSPASFPWVH